jgi:hypothetical protein
MNQAGLVSFEELRQVDRELADATDAINTLTLHVASCRETGSPPVYVHP